MNEIVEELKSEWSYPLASDDVGSSRQVIQFEADAEQSSALARRLGVESLSHVKAEMVVQRNGGNLVVYIQGKVSADVVQKCVVTLEPLGARIEEDFEAWYADPDSAVSFAKERQRIMALKHGEETPILDEKDDPEPIENGVIDLGELATQYLILGLEPYPHAPGVKYEIGDDDPRSEASSIRENPFAKLKDWKAKTES